MENQSGYYCKLQKIKVYCPVIIRCECAVLLSVHALLTIQYFEQSFYLLYLAFTVHALPTNRDKPGSIVLLNENHASTRTIRISKDHVCRQLQVEQSHFCVSSTSPVLRHT